MSPSSIWAVPREDAIFLEKMSHHIAGGFHTIP